MHKLLFLLALLNISCADFRHQRDYNTLLPTLKLPEYNRSQLESNKAYEPKGDFYIQWPVKKIIVSQKFRPSHNSKHEGLDLVHYRGAPISAAHEGYVVYSGNGYSGYGNVVIIQYSSRWASLYAHLRKIHVKEGQVVRRGELIGSMGRTGRTTGVHLHFELLKNKLPVNPLEYLPSLQSVAKRR